MLISNDTRERGSVVEWFSALAMEQKVRGSNPDRGENPCDWKTLSVHPAVSGYLIQFREGSKAAEGEGWAPSSICCALDTVNLNSSLQLRPIRLCDL